MVTGIVIGGMVIVAVGYCFALRTLFRQPTPRERAARTYQAAAAQVDDILAQARIRMEEAAGWRRPGEQRLGDNIRGSWRNW